MKKVYKILIAVLVFFVSIYIFTTFFLINFPYDRLFQYINRKYFPEYGITTSAEKVVYKLPNRLVIENFEVLSENNRSVIQVEKIEARYRLFKFRKYRDVKDIVLRIRGVSYSDQYMKANGDEIRLMINLKTKGFVNIPSAINGLESIVLDGNEVIVDSLNVSAIELDKLKISSLKLDVVSELDEFFIKEGEILGDGLKIEIGGKLNRNSMDIGLRFRVDDKLYKENQSFQILKNFVKDVNDFSVFFRGNPSKPLVSVS